MRRIIQATGVEVIHLGHDRSVDEVVNCAIQEDVQAIAMTSYQGGHVEYFKYMHDLLKRKMHRILRFSAVVGNNFAFRKLKNYMLTVLPAFILPTTADRWDCRAWSTTWWRKVIMRPECTWMES